MPDCNHPLHPVIRPLIVCCAVLCTISASAGGRNLSDTESAAKVIFSTNLPDVPGKQLVVVELTLRPRSTQPSMAHRHPGSVYVYVTKGVARLGVEGQPIQQVPAGGSFFEPAGVLHTVTESDSATESASALAVAIVPEGAPLVIVDEQAR